MTFKGIGVAQQERVQVLKNLVGHLKSQLATFNRNGTPELGDPRSKDRQAVALNQDAGKPPTRSPNHSTVPAIGEQLRLDTLHGPRPFQDRFVMASSDDCGVVRTAGRGEAPV